MKLIRLAIIALVSFTNLSRADESLNFYKDKNIQLIIPGGGVYTDLGIIVSTHLGKHIPGNPKVIMKNMPGGNGRIATNYAYNTLPRDGTAILEMNFTAALSQALNEENVNYSSEKFKYIGSPIVVKNVVAISSLSGIKTIEESKYKQIILGADATTSQGYIFPKVANELLGTKFKIILGYKDVATAFLAMEKGEIDGVGSVPWPLLRSQRKDLLVNNKLNILAQTGIEPILDLPGIPYLMDFSSNNEDKEIFRLLGTSSNLGIPFVFPPETPDERVKIIQIAFEKMTNDREFIIDLDKIGSTVDFKNGKQIEDYTFRILNTDPNILSRLKEILKK